MDLSIPFSLLRGQTAGLRAIQPIPYALRSISVHPAFRISEEMKGGSINHSKRAAAFRIDGIFLWLSS